MGDISFPTIPLSVAIPLVAGGSTNGISLTQTITGAAAAGPIAIGLRNGLTITGNMSLVTGNTDLLSGNFTTTWTGITAGPMTVCGGFQAGIYLGAGPGDNAGVTFNGVRGFVMHSEVNSACTVTLLKGMEMVLTNNAGTITGLRWIDIPDTASTPGGGSIGNEWALYSPGANAKVEVLGISRLGKIDVNGTSSSGVANGFYLAAANQLALRTNSVDRVLLNATAMQVNVPVKLANAYVNTPVVTTGSVTVQDSTGTTYRLACAV